MGRIHFRFPHNLTVKQFSTVFVAEYPKLPKLVVTLPRKTQQFWDSMLGNICLHWVHQIKIEAILEPVKV
jgi:hypothetical protein